MARKSHSPTTKTSSIVIDGASYLLCFDFNAIAIAERQAGMNLLIKLDMSSLDASTLRALFYSALLKFQPDITIDAAGDLIRLDNMAAILDAIGKAWTAAVPQGDSPKQEPEAPASE